ncbi:hypothetical protein [Enterococcus sp. DIV2324]|uniref:hypothetical protein n=1 Tax=Enterococcus sp. DIV2324 TaxID=2774763 RepID=UPI003F22F028
MDELISVSSIAAFIILFFWQINSKRKEVAYILNPKNEHSVVKLAFYDHSYKKESLEKLRSVRLALKKEEFEKQRGKTVIRLHPYNTSFEYVERLIYKIESDFYAEELAQLPKEDQRLDNWDQF